MQTDTETRRRRMAMLQVTLGATLISFSPVFVKLVQVGPATAAFYRMFFGGIILLAILLVRRERVWAGWGALGLALVAGIFFALDLSLFHQSILYVGPGLSTLLGNCQVFFLAAFGILVYRERPGWLYLLSLPLAVVGIFLIVGGDWQGLSAQFKIGIWLSLGGAFCYATYLLLMGRPQARAGALSPLANLTIICWITIPILRRAIAGLCHREPGDRLVVDLTWVAYPRRFPGRPPIIAATGLGFPLGHPLLPKADHHCGRVWSSLDHLGYLHGYDGKKQTQCTTEVKLTKGEQMTMEYQATTCRESIASLPDLFTPTLAGKLKAEIQFRFTGDEP
ncbi:MAG: DMT family transporter, partial [Coprothermobacterota bacterium]|nr:DMT family transporter [Coprothermobacterota bacterium]